MFVWNKIPTQSYSAKFLYWGDHVNSVPGLAASPPLIYTLPYRQYFVLVYWSRIDVEKLTSQ